MTRSYSLCGTNLPAATTGCFVAATTGCFVASTTGCFVAATAGCLVAVNGVVAALAFGRHVCAGPALESQCTLAVTADNYLEPSNSDILVIL